MYVKFVFVLVCSVFLLGSKIPNRKPDVVSQRAKISDYYIYDKKSRKWIWKPDYYAAVRKKMAKNRKKYRKLQAKKKLLNLKVLRN